jgi:hypothetical protein
MMQLASLFLESHSLSSISALSQVELIFVEYTSSASPDKVSPRTGHETPEIDGFVKKGRKQHGYLAN